MKITSLTVGNLKGFREVQRIPIAPVTLLFGPNSAGKSTVLQGLSLLHSILHEFSYNPSTTRQGEGAMDLGGFKRLVHGHDLDRDIHLGITLDLEAEDLLETESALAWSDLKERYDQAGASEDLFDLGEYTAQIESITCEIGLGWSDTLKRPFVRNAGIGFNGTKIFSLTCTQDGRRRELAQINVNHSSLAGTLDNNWFGALATSLRPEYGDIESGAMQIGIITSKDALPDWRRSFRIGDVFDDVDSLRAPVDGLSGDTLGHLEQIRATKAALSALIAGPFELVANYLDNTRYIGPLRKLPHRVHQTRFDTFSWATGLAAWDRLSVNATVRDSVNEWLHDHEYAGQRRGLLSGYRIEVSKYREVAEGTQLWAALRSNDPSKHGELIRDGLDSSTTGERLRLRDVKRGILVTPQEVGVGVSQIVPVLTGCVDETIPVLSVEQPELHIHPRMQVALGDLLVECTSAGGKTLVLESHSEHLILRLLRRIREREVTADHVSVVYVRQTDGASVIERLDITEDGDFEVDWPDGFFEERDSELLF